MRTRTEAGVHLHVIDVDAVALPELFQDDAVGPVAADQLALGRVAGPGTVAVAAHQPSAQRALDPALDRPVAAQTHLHRKTKWICQSFVTRSYKNRSFSAVETAYFISRDFTGQSNWI